jgi:two-component system chemotaxis response regulator CheB
MAMTKTKRVLIAEDSIFIQKVLVKIMEADPELQVVGVAKDGKAAVEMTRILHPDVITMDIRMPVMDGFQATRLIMTENPTPILVVSSSVHAEDLRISFNAIQAGALDIMEKPRGNLAGDYYHLGQEIIRKVKLIAGIRVFRHLSPKFRGDAAANQQKMIAKTRNKGVAIGASTGGPSALFQVITSLNPDFPAPVFVTLHISEGFGKGCADWLNRNAKVEVRIPADGETIQPGVVYFAPDDRVMRVANRTSISVEGDKMDRSVMPIDAMMDSFAGAYGQNGIGVLLTGMGNDGARGMARLKRVGGKGIAQDEETSVVFGMPKEAIAMGGVDVVLPVDRIAAQIETYLNNG